MDTKVDIYYYIQFTVPASVSAVSYSQQHAVIGFLETEWESEECFLKLSFDLKLYKTCVSAVRRRAISFAANP